jgi:hypothetical protein
MADIERMRAKDWDAQWLSFESAAEMIRARLGGSIGASHAALRAAVAAGTIRSFEFNDDGIVADPRRSVFFYNKDDLLYWLDQQRPLPPPPLAHANLRHSSDEPLIQEAIIALANGAVKKPLQAAKLVYLRAHGPSATSNLDRLRKAIAKEWKARAAKSSPKIAKSSPNR